MILSFKQIAAAVVLEICAVSMSGVMAQQSTVSTVRVIRYQGDFTMALTNMSGTFGLTIGLELDTQRYRTVTVSLDDATVTDIVNAIVQSSKKYQWQQTGGFIDVWPLAGSNPLLETKINSFNVKDLSPSEAFDRLLNLPEVQQNMTALNLKRRAPDVAPEKLSSARFSVNLEGVSLREALNKIAQESHIGIWIFRNYPNGFFSISSLER
jgi:hypothetical protein